MAVMHLCCQNEPLQPWYSNGLQVLKGLNTSLQFGLVQPQHKKQSKASVLVVLMHTEAVFNTSGKLICLGLVGWTQTVGWARHSPIDHCCSHT